MIERVATAVGLCAVLSLSAGARLDAQCPDGAPPPCRSDARPTPDRSRVAVFPFRVTTADSLLGEGVAELVALELANGTGLRPVHMGSALSAWRSAGGGLRAPLPIEGASRVARSLGAGRLADGSVVLTGSRITIAASIVSATDGAMQRVPSVSGPADSLESLARRLSVALLTAVGGEPHAAAGYRLTDSPEALRAYLEGLSAWRRRQYQRANAAFDRAIEIDSAFANAAYARMRVTQYTLQPDASRWEQLAWRHQSRLNAEERVVLRALLGVSYPAPRLMAERLRDLENAARDFPDSPEALYHLGDFFFHYGRATGITSADDRALALFERSATLDTQSTTFIHLFGPSLRRGDTATLRRHWAAYESFFGSGVDARIGWLIGQLLGDASLRTRMTRQRLAFGYFMSEAAGMGLSARVIDTMHAISAATAPAANSTWLSYANAAVIQGRPAAAAQRLAVWGAADGGLLRDAFLIAAAVASDGDPAAADSAAARLRQADVALPANRARAQCAVALFDANRGKAARWDDGLLREHGHLNCSVMLKLLEADRTRSLTPSSLASADSLLQERLDFTQYAGIENLVLARLWERLSDMPRALASARRVHTGYTAGGGIGGSGSMLSLTPSVRMEARLAAQLGDTAGALRAYERYLVLRRDSEAALRPQRDSVRNELARLRPSRTTP